MSLTGNWSPDHLQFGEEILIAGRMRASVKLSTFKFPESVVMLHGK
jgi:hypothetical protein